MVSMQSEGKIEWLQELGPIIKQSQLTKVDVSNGIVINVWKNRKVNSEGCRAQ